MFPDRFPFCLPWKLKSCLAGIGGCIPEPSVQWHLQSSSFRRFLVVKYCLMISLVTMAMKGEPELVLDCAALF